MNPRCGVQEMLRLAKAPPKDRERIVLRMCPNDIVALDVAFENWVHDNQQPPRDEGWRTWLMMAGRGFGKTRAGAEWIFGLARSRPGVRIALVGASIADARSIMVEGVSGILAVAEMRKRRVRWEPSTGKLVWPNGSQAQIFSGDSPDGLRGPEHDFAWADELAKWRDAEETWNNLQMGLRRVPRARALITTTPRPLKLLETIQESEWTVTTTGRTDENINLDPHFAKVMWATYGGTRLGEQELEGKLNLQVEGSLWPRELLARCRFRGPLPTFDRVVIGVDPPAGPSTSSGRARGGDACGIVVAGSAGGRLYVLADESVRRLSPEGWSSRVAMAVARWGAGLVVAEANNGGAMVESVLKAADSGLKVRLVHASRGKVARAEPISLLFEKGRAVLAGEFATLEDELAGMVAGGDYDGPGKSPDRADAMVWALTALSETRSGVPRVRAL